MSRNCEIGKSRGAAAGRAKISARRGSDQLSGINRAGFEPFRGAAIISDAPESPTLDSRKFCVDGMSTERLKSGADNQ
jgi:hypothetical protein